MDGASICPYPHYSWLAYSLSIRPPRLLDVHQCQHVTHWLLFTTEGHADVTWTSNGCETRFRAAPETVGFFPRDGDTHVMAVTAADGYRGHVLCLPVGHLPPRAPPTASLPTLPEFRDATLTACLHRLAILQTGCPLAEGVGDEIAARQIVLRLAERLGTLCPDWLTDRSRFTAPVMRHLVAEVDASLTGGSSARALAPLVGLSASQFARKFRQSAGVSLNRFLNRRRIRRSLALLEDDSLQLSRVALDLGFSSQSHFTRLFSSLTGLTPSGFRRQSRRSLG
jgi:AraC-like DNA-binding protein